jgi:peptidoglycan/LPS O-acetylase OafA/YrhL
MIITWWAATPEPGSAMPNGKSAVVYGLLVQDVFAAPVPNGALWSIAVEAQLYFTFPLLILFMRRYGWWAVIATATLPVVAIGLLAPHVSTVDKLLRLTPQFAPLFALGLVAAGVISAPERIRRLPLQWLALAAALPVLVLIVVNGSEWTVHHFFWIDIAVGPAIALLLAAVATRRPAPLVWLLGTPPVRSLGLFSYSLYLVHAPIVVIVASRFVAPHVAAGVPAFLVTLAVSVPVCLVFARLFAAVFEIPFQRYRSWPALRAAMVTRWAALRGTRPAPVPHPVIPHQPIAAEVAIPEPATEP